MEKNNNERTLECELCGKKFSSVKAVYGHMKVHSNGHNKNPFVALKHGCTICNESFASSSILSTHMDSHYDSEDTQIRNAARGIMKIPTDPEAKYVVLGKSPERNSAVLETRSSSRTEQRNVKSKGLERVRYGDDDDDDSDISRDEVGVKEEISEYEMSKSQRVLAYQTQLWGSSSRSEMVKEAADVGDDQKSKVHKCPVCFMEFKSGQALGGHKKAHNTK